MVPELLELPHLRQQHGVADVQIGPRRIEARLDAQRLAGLARLVEPLLELGADVQVDDAAREQRDLFGSDRRKRRHDAATTVVDRGRLRQSSSSSPPVIVACVRRLLLTSSFSSLPTLKNGRRFAGTGTGSPVRGLRPE